VDVFARTLNVSLHHESDNAGQHWPESGMDAAFDGTKGEGANSLPKIIGCIAIERLSI